MAVYAIVLISPHEEVKRRIVQHFPGNYEYNPTFFLVESDMLTQNLATLVGIKGDDRIADASGFVVKLEEFSYAGYTTRALWEWLKGMEKKSHE